MKKEDLYVPSLQYVPSIRNENQTEIFQHYHDLVEKYNLLVDIVNDLVEKISKLEDKVND
jgi:hypothetical protein